MTRTMVTAAALALALGAVPALAQTSTTTTTDTGTAAQAGQLAEADQKFIEKAAQDMKDNGDMMGMDGMGAEQAGAVMGLMQSAMNSIAKDGRSVLGGLTADDKGLLIELAANFKEGSESAAKFTKGEYMNAGPGRIPGVLREQVRRPGPALGHGQRQPSGRPDAADQRTAGRPAEHRAQRVVPGDQHVQGLLDLDRPDAGADPGDRRHGDRRLADAVQQGLLRVRDGVGHRLGVRVSHPGRHACEARLSHRAPPPHGPAPRPPAPRTRAGWGRRAGRGR